MGIVLHVDCNRGYGSAIGTITETLKIETNKTIGDFPNSGLLAFAYLHRDHYHLLDADLHGNVRNNTITDLYIEEPPKTDLDRFHYDLSESVETLKGEYDKNGTRREIEFRVSSKITKNLKKGKIGGYSCLFKFLDGNYFQLHVSYVKKKFKVNSPRFVEMLTDYKVIGGN